MDINTLNESQSHAYSDEVNYPLKIQVPVFAFVVLLLIFGCGGNALVIIVILKYRKLRDNTVTFLLHLAITDFITAFVVCFYGLSYDTGIRNASFFSCIIHEQTVTYMIFVSEFVLAVVSFDRYIAVCHGVQYSKIITKNVVNMLLSISWVVPIIFTIYPVFGFNNLNKLKTCMYHNLFHDWVYDMYSSIMIVLMIIPIVFYVMVLAKAREFYRKFSPAQIQGINAKTMRVRRKKQSITNGKIMGVVTLVFMLCWLPLSIYQFQFGIDFDYSTPENRVAMLIITYLGLLNCIVNPVIYAWQKKDFQSEARRILKCTKCCKRAVCTQEDLNVNSLCQVENQGNRVTFLKMESNVSKPTTFSRQAVAGSLMSAKGATNDAGSFLSKDGHVDINLPHSSNVDFARPKTIQVKPYVHVIAS
ncbi:hypothetical protein FSP39_003924 [Pinctada imbricata]|uniref:G-protein coupled receptors family 1 profile domain-containing protein n=1 Tax=Pinctada imbricata TaxID=66713 RepID=A0AA88YPU7_PINIB|nr:hypothetical protein FSP39_003924 [Pinctada imbricata]